MSRLCIIIGGSKGLGAALLTQYQQNNYEIIEFSRTGEGIGHYDVDLSRKELAIDIVDQVFFEVSQKDWSEVTLIVNAAVLQPVGPLHTSEPKQWWEHIDVNFTLPISIFGRFQTHFSDKPYQKTAAFISSGAAVSAIEGWSLYCAVKAGVDHFMRTMALEQADAAHPINCIILNPGVMDTDMQVDIRSSTTDQFKNVQRFIDLHSAGELKEPSTVAKNIFDRLSGKLINGERLDVSG